MAAIYTIRMYDGDGRFRGYLTDTRTTPPRKWFMTKHSAEDYAILRSGELAADWSLKVCADSLPVLEHTYRKERKQP